MIKHLSTISVRYAETDQMGYVHHSQYALYVEEARMELLRTIGIDCGELEKDGVIMPVVAMENRFSMPLYFGDTITVKTEIRPPWNTKLVFRFRIYNQDNKLVSRGSTSLVFADKDSGSLLEDPGKYLASFTRASMELTQ